MAEISVGDVPAVEGTMVDTPPILPPDDMDLSVTVMPSAVGDQANMASATGDRGKDPDLNSGVFANRENAIDPGNVPVDDAAALNTTVDTNTYNPHPEESKEGVKEAIADGAFAATENTANRAGEIDANRIQNGPGNQEAQQDNTGSQEAQQDNTGNQEAQKNSNGSQEAQKNENSLNAYFKRHIKEFAIIATQTIGSGIEAERQKQEAERTKITGQLAVSAAAAGLGRLA